MQPCAHAPESQKQRKEKCAYSSERACFFNPPVFHAMKVKVVSKQWWWEQPSRSHLQQ